MLELTAVEELLTNRIKPVIRSKQMTYGFQFSYLIHLEFQPWAEINPLHKKGQVLCSTGLPVTVRYSGLYSLHFKNFF